MFTLIPTLSGEMEDLIPVFLNITSKSLLTLNSTDIPPQLVFSKLSESVMEVDTTDTCVSDQTDHIIELGKALDGMVIGTESTYSITNSIHGNSLFKMDKDRKLTLMMFWLVLTATTTLTSIGQTL
jgi:hypothetical protein